ncbi:hypothetical protein [Hephaestia caeni]|nr:hypothetical protein [Hephaestia caeni]
MRTITFEQSFSPDELAKALMDAGFSGRAWLENIAAGKSGIFDSADDEIALDCVVDEDEVIDALGDEAIIKAAEECKVDGANERAIEDGIRYVRAGDLGLARAMFARVFEDGDLPAAERALS